jgi:hypothetical protein
VSVVWSTSPSGIIWGPFAGRLIFGLDDGSGNVSGLALSCMCVIRVCRYGTSLPGGDVSGWMFGDGPDGRIFYSIARTRALLCLTSLSADADWAMDAQKVLGLEHGIRKASTEQLLEVHSRFGTATTVICQVCSSISRLVCFDESQVRWSAVLKF